MDLAYIGYLLFVVPGFCFIWTYRHFTKAPKLEGFEFAAWSLFFGSLISLVSLKIVLFVGTPLHEIPLNDPAAMLGGILGAGLGIATGGSFPLGFIVAIMQRKGYFEQLDKWLFWLIVKLAKV